MSVRTAKFSGIKIVFLSYINIKSDFMSSTKRKVFVLILSALLAVDLGVVAFIVHKII